ncbi:MAG: bifunctional 23S rRNA (guanine(2069)-N(7))-methyltransferase RlmK/23S rRNA (guanine(2445)-N(2))-methyltransferase RlmL [Planctomycetia bacterium]|jgi:23S rRNA (guanine2445-N2)-methyltransferase / 23S rRNA (guanine2069-N7)-methyltransferase
MPNTPLNLIATTTFGLEAVVARELVALGYETKTLQPGWVGFRGDFTAIARANLWLRTADRVLVQLGSFEATDFGQLFDQTFALPWHEWITPDGAFVVNGRSIKSQLSSVPACQKIVKKSIVEKLKTAHHVEELPESGEKFPVEVALLEDRATLVLDTTGPSLHKRGYRKLVGQAPLKETLAAALILLSYWRPNRPLVDPFCGTGTIPIEAAMIGRNMAPGMNRDFTAETWPCIPGDAWDEAYKEACDLARPDTPLLILGTDRDEKTLSLARYHAREAGVQDAVQFSQRDFAELSSPREYGCIITNPPYGERLGERDEIEQLYRSIPDVLRRLPTWSHYIISSHPAFEKVIGQKADRRRKLYNGRIACTYFQFHGPRPPKPDVEPEVSHLACEVPENVPQLERLTDEEKTEEPPVQAFGGLTEKAAEQGKLFRTRLLKRARHLRRYPTRQGITCYRIYERDIPEIPLVVDRYESALHITEYERPHDRTPAEHADWLDLMCRTAAKALEVDPREVYLKQRQKLHGPSQYERVADENRTLVVHEGGLKFEVNLSDYVDTGLFLDHRITRSMVRDAADGRRFLNLFAYTGSFSVYAAAGGAVSTRTVDLSNTYLDWARRNMTINGFDGPEHDFVRSDILEFLDRDRDTYDLAVVDPPTYSRSKRTEQDWDVQRDHVELLHRLFARMNPGGIVYFSTNFRRFKFDESQFSGLMIREISKQTIPPEYRNQRIHRCWRLVLPE